MATFDPQLLQRFQSAAESLKLYRRADLTDPEEGTSVDDLYVDPLPPPAALCHQGGERLLQRHIE